MTIYTDPEENEDYGFVFPPHGHRPPEIRYPRPRHRHRHHHPLLSTPLGMGPRGPQGETFTFDDLTDEQLAELREDVASVYHRKLESVYTTTGDSTSQIPIPWDNFDPEKDMLFVRIEGLWLHANEYTVSEGNIVLTTPITHAGTAVGITMITTVAMSVEDIENLHGEDGFSPTVSMTRQNNGTLLSITDADGTTSALIPDGVTGPTGQTGPVGPAGPQGPKGDKGDKGDVGPVGPKGQKGDKGDKGDAGLQGPKGDTGDQGPQGVTGPVGPQGQKGDTGPAGHDGVSPTASVERVEGGALVTVTDASGTTTAMLNDAEITEGSVTDAMLAPDGIKAQVSQLWGNQLKGTLTGDLLTASDAYAAPPVAIVVDGRSTQDGTPTPDAPVPIESVDELTLAFAGKNLFDPSYLLEASGWTVSDGVYTGIIGQLYNIYNFNTLYPVGGLLDTPQTYTVSLDYSPTDSSKVTYVLFVYADGVSGYNNRMTEGGHYVFASDGAKVLRSIAFSYSSNQTVSLSNIQLEAGSTATAYEPYEGHTVPIPLYDGTLRSLPDGTKDTLALTYLRPSAREGWAWYGRTLVQNIKRVTFDETENWHTYSYPSGAGYYTTTKVRDNYKQMKLCNMAISASNGASGKNTCYFGGAGEVNMVGVTDSAPTLADWLALVTATPVIVDYHLTTPITTTIDPIELPVLPAPECTVWADPTTGLVMEYVRDTSIVIAAFEAALADLATS